MSRELLLAILVITVLFSQATSSQPLNCEPSLITQSERVHNLDTGLNYTTIQEAIDANETLNGHTIKVDTGIYYEHVVINKSVSLIGQNRSSTIIDGNFTGTVVWAKANKVTIMEFTIRAGQTGIFLDHSSNSKIARNTFASNGDGTFLYHACNNLISENTITHNGIGIHLQHFCKNNTIERNLVEYSWTGIDLSGNSNNNSVTLNVLTNNENNGIEVSVSDNNSIIKNAVTENLHGISLSFSKNSTIASNTLINNTNPFPGDTGKGIYLENCDNCTLHDNSLEQNMHGIYLRFSVNCTLSDNTMKSNDYNFRVIGVFPEHFVHKVDVSNRVDDKPIYYLINQHDMQVPQDAGCVAAINCTNITVENLNLTHNGQGALFAYTHDCKIINSRLSHNFYGILLADSSNCVIQRNNLSNNGYCAIYFDNSDNCIVTENDVRQNYCIFGMRHGSTNNKLFHNNFVNNPWIGTFDRSCQNAWDDGVEGNYWTDYTGVDLNPDGIGDTEHMIDENNTDRYPLMGMFSSFNVISNSTIEDFEYFESNSTIRMYVSNMTANQTFGFCRVCIPHTLMDVSDISVIIDDEAVEVLHFNNTIYDNDTHRWIYFAYQHSTHEIVIVLEFPSFLILPLFMIATLLAIVVYRKKYPIGN
jgi:parallel beta-helix repeat protein